MEKIETGMYVRTEEGRIFKTDGDKFYLSNNKKIFYRLLTRIPHESASYKVIKTSYNIIDLIEIGDYVNGEPVIGVEKFKDGSIYLIFSEDRYIKRLSDIETIVTQEQFENMKYEVK